MASDQDHEWKELSTQSSTPIGIDETLKNVHVLNHFMDHQLAQGGSFKAIKFGGLNRVVEAGIDGFRCDMAMLTPVDFWLEARQALEQDRHLFWLAELDPLDNPDYMRVFDAAYTWRWMNAATSFRKEGSRQIHHLRYVLGQYSDVLPSTACPAWFTSNHDENSWNGTEYEKYEEI